MKALLAIERRADLDGGRDLPAAGVAAGRLLGVSCHRPGRLSRRGRRYPLAASGVVMLVKHVLI